MRDAPPPHPDDTPVERIPSSAPGPAAIALVCDHAAAALPTRLGDLGVSEADRARHIAYDIGARGVTLGLAARLGAPATLATWSRLAIDPNRGEDDPTLIMRIYDRSIIPGNARVDAAERARRIDDLHRPYHDAVGAMIARDGSAGPPLVVSIHSFTPQLRGKPPRPWHVGVLWRDDPATARRLLDALGRAPDLVVGDNQPYPGAYDGDTMTRHAASRGARHVVIEIRNDLIADADGQSAWADRLAGPLAAIAAE